MKEWQQVLLGVLEGVVIFVLILLLFLAYGSINNRWYRLLVVKSGSMSPTFEAGDMILVVPAPPPEELEPGMVAAFRTLDGELVTHRIVAIDGGCIKTKGDANKDVDSWTYANGEPYQITDVGAIYRARIPYLGYLVVSLRNVFL